MTYAFPKEFFTLCVIFAKKISTHYDLELETSLFTYTPVYVRLLGFHDEVLPDNNNQQWKKIIKNLPDNHEKRISYIWELYKKFEDTKPKSSNQLRFGCFSYSYHQSIDQFELHFANADPLGNLTEERRNIRENELYTMVQSMKKLQKPTATIHVHSWLLNIPAFTRLFPKPFIARKKIMIPNTIQDNTYWGQFVDKHGKVKQALADQLIINTREKKATISEYFPIQAFVIDAPQPLFFNYFT